MAKRYTQEEIDYIKEHYGKIPTKEIAKHLRRPLGGMQAKAEQLGLKAFPEHVEFICPICKESFMACPSFKQKRKYCSRTCYLIAHKTNKQISDQFCLCGCGQMTKPGSKWIMGHNSRGINSYDQAKHTLKYSPQYCKQCGSLIIFNPKYDLEYYKERQYCSKRCAGIQGGRPKSLQVKRICKNCNKEFIVTETHLKHHKAIYCSVSCANEDLFKGKPKSKEHNQKNSEAHLANPPTWSKFQNTSIEIALQNELKKRNIPFETHLAIEKICRPDIVFLNYKLAVQADGDYWHGDNFPKQQQRDIENDAKLKNKGWTILRFSGSEIQANISACIDKIELELHK